MSLAGDTHAGLVTAAASLPDDVRLSGEHLVSSTASACTAALRAADAVGEPDSIGTAQKCHNLGPGPAMPSLLGTGLHRQRHLVAKQRGASTELEVTPSTDSVPGCYATAPSQAPSQLSVVVAQQDAG